MNADEILMDVEERMEKSVDTLKKNLTGIRTGRANPGLVDTLRVEAYGSPTPIKQVAAVSFVRTIPARSRTLRRRSSPATWG